MNFGSSLSTNPPGPGTFSGARPGAMVFEKPGAENFQDHNGDGTHQGGIYIYKYNNLYIYIYVYIDIYIYIYIFYRHLGEPLRIFEYLIEGFECIWVVKLTSKDFQGLQLSCLKQYTCLPTTQIKFTKTQREMSWDLQSPPTILNLVMFNMYIIYIYIHIYICVCLRVSSVQLIYYIHILYIYKTYTI